ncbi:U3 snoRNP protein [Rhodotorula kratochvilovae]
MSIWQVLLMNMLPPADFASSLSDHTASPRASSSHGASVPTLLPMFLRSILEPSCPALDSRAFRFKLHQRIIVHPDTDVDQWLACAKELVCAKEAKSPEGVHLARNAESQKDGIDVPENEANALVVLDVNPGVLAPDQPALTVLFAATTLAPDHEIASIRRAAELDPEDPLKHEITFVYRTASTPRYILNGGATCHMTTERDVLIDYRAFSTPRRVGGAFSSVGEAIGKGKIALQLSGGTLKLKGVLLTPKLGVNLISQMCLMLDGFTLINTAKVLTMHDPDGHALATLPVGPTIYVK